MTITSWGDICKAILSVTDGPYMLSNPIGQVEVTELGDIRRLSLTVDLIPERYQATDKDIPF